MSAAKDKGMVSTTKHHQACIRGEHHHVCTISTTKDKDMVSTAVYEAKVACMCVQACVCAYFSLSSAVIFEVLF